MKQTQEFLQNYSILDRQQQSQELQCICYPSLLIVLFRVTYVSNLRVRWKISLKEKVEQNNWMKTLSNCVNAQNKIASYFS